MILKNGGKVLQLKASLTILYDFYLKTIYLCVRLNEFEPSYFLFFFGKGSFVLFLAGLILLHRYPSHAKGV